MTVQVEIHGFELPGTHGVGAEERERGQVFVFDVTLELEPPAEDSIEATVDYRAVRDVVRDVSSATSYHLLESLSEAVAGAIVEKFDVERVTVHVRKVGVVWAEWTGATSTRSKR